MKTQKKHGLCFYLQKSNKRWKWMAGATAAGVSAAQASTITINLTGNYISGTGGNHLNADLTGDGHPDLTIANAFNSMHIRDSSFGQCYIRYRARANLNGVRASAYFYNDHDYGSVQLGTQRKDFGPGSQTSASFASLTGSIPLFFKDLHINGGAPTSGLLQVTVITAGQGPNGPASVQLDTFTYTSNTPAGNVSSTVPEQGSTLALLAMGAGGVLALRRWRTAQGRS